MLNDDALAQIAFIAERRSSSAVRLKPANLWLSPRHVAGLGSGELLSPLTLGALFWALTYILFTARAFTITGNVEIVSGIRFTTTGVGAVLVGLFLLQINEKTIDRNTIILRVLVVTVGASFAVWTVRNVYAVFDPQSWMSMADNSRWAMFWAGYCTSFLSLYLLYISRRGQASSRGAASDPITAREAALSWLLGAFAGELNRKGEGLDRAFLDRLARDLPIVPVAPPGTASSEMINAGDQIINRLGQTYRAREPEPRRGRSATSRPAAA